MVLFINACARPQSRTLALARKTAETVGGPVETVNLYEENPAPFDYKRLSERDDCIARGDYAGEMFRLARQFREADEIIIAAPFWDMSFPAMLKQYLEQVTVTHLTFFYSEEGIPQGLCRAKKLYYVTTAGGTIFHEEYGFGYVRALAENLFGISQTEMIKAEGLDIVGADVEGILRQAEDMIDRMELDRARPGDSKMMEDVVLKTVR